MKPKQTQPNPKQPDVKAIDVARSLLSIDMRAWTDAQLREGAEIVAEALVRFSESQCTCGAILALWRSEGIEAIDDHRCSVHPDAFDHLAMLLGAYEGERNQWRAACERWKEAAASAELQLKEREGTMAFLRELAEKRDERVQALEKHSGAQQREIRDLKNERIKLRAWCDVSADYLSRHEVSHGRIAVEEIATALRKIAAGEEIDA